MTEITDPRRIATWISMADHFLDTETRHDIPLTALCCVEAGLSTAEACDVWRYEVSPAVAFNVWDMVGEWACWEQDWLVQRIERLRKRKENRPGPFGWLLYRIRVHFLDGVWVSMGRCLDALLAVPPGERERLAKDLAFLGRHYFDFCGAAFGSLDAAERKRVRALYPEPFVRIMEPVLSSGEARVCDLRIRAALEQGPTP